MNDTTTSVKTTFGRVTGRFADTAFRRSLFADTAFRRQGVSPTRRFADTAFRRHGFSPTRRFADMGVSPTRRFADMGVSPTRRFIAWAFRRHGVSPTWAFGRLKCMPANSTHNQHMAFCRHDTYMQLQVRLTQLKRMHCKCFNPAVASLFYIR